MKTNLFLLMMFWQSLGFAYNAGEVSKCIASLKPAMPLAQNHQLANSASLFLFHSSGYGGTLGTPQEGGLVFDSEGVKVCGFQWHSQSADKVYGFKLLGTRYRFQQQPPELSVLGLIDGRLLNMQKPECALDTTGQTNTYVHELVIKALIESEGSTRVSSTQRLDCMRSVNIQQSEYDTRRTDGKIVPGAAVAN